MPSRRARTPASTTGAGAVKSGSPISMCTTRRPSASSACARASTSMTSKGSISAARRAVSLSMTVRDYNFLVDEQLKKNALEYHRRKPAGKISVLPTKQLTNQRDLALAYTPGVAAACEEIVRGPECLLHYTAGSTPI